MTISTRLWRILHTLESLAASARNAAAFSRSFATSSTEDIFRADDENPVMVGVATDHPRVAGVKAAD